MLYTILVVCMIVASVAGWLATSVINHRAYNRWLGKKNAGMDRDFLVMIGPFGTMLLLSGWLLDLLIKLAARFGVH